MTYYVGQRIRFGATIRDGQGMAIDPKDSITATISTEREVSLGDATPTESAKTYALGRGVERDGVGAYYIDFTLNDPGVVTVRFGSPSTGFAERRYQVDERVDEMSSAAAAQPVTEDQPINQDADDEPAEHADAFTKEEMLAELRDRGVPVDETRSHEFVAAIYRTYAGGHGTRADAAHAHARGAARDLEREVSKGRSPHDAYRARQRGQ